VEEGAESSADASLYLILKEKKRRRAIRIGAAAASIAVLCIILGVIFWSTRTDDKNAKVTKKAMPQKGIDVGGQEVAGTLESILKVRATATPEAGFSDYSKAVNDALIELNALPQEAPRVEKLKAVMNYYQAAKELWVGIILLETTPLESVEEKVARSLYLLDFLDRSTGTCRKELDKKDAAMCSSLAALQLWKQKGTYAVKDDRRRIKERLDPIRTELWAKGSAALDAYER